MKDEIKLRIINSIGAFLFSIYAYNRNDYPIIFINVSILIINLYYIIKNKIK